MILPDFANDFYSWIEKYGKTAWWFMYWVWKLLVGEAPKIKIEFSNHQIQRNFERLAVFPAVPFQLS